MGLISEECVQRFKIGLAMGALVGGSMGALIGTYSVLRYGHHGEGFLRSVSRSAVGSGSFFALIMGIGGLIRCEPSLLTKADLHLLETTENAHILHPHPLLMKRW